MTLQEVPLGDLVTITGGGTPRRDRSDYWDGPIPWASVKDLNGSYLAETKETITGAGLADSATHLIPPGSLIVATRMGLGKVAINSIPIAINQDLKALWCKPEVDPRYLMRFLQFRGPQIEAMGKGATVKGIKLEQLARLPVPLPDLSEQRRIAAVLDNADELYRKREESIRLTDELLRSRFLDMFGDPVRNPKRWGNPTLGGLLTFQQYGPRFYNTSYSVDGVRIARITDLSSIGELDFEAMPRMSVSDEDKAKFQLKPGDLIVARTGATDDKVALIRQRDPPCIAGAYFIRVRFREELSPTYAATVLRLPSLQAIVAKRSRQAAQQNFSGPNLRRLPMPLPPTELQRDFERYSANCAEMKATQHSSLTGAKALKQSLLYRAFRGEL